MSGPSPITVLTPDGKRHSVKSAEGEDVWLSDALANAGLSLNTRCRGRGLCRGCLVERKGEWLRACQCKMQALAGETIVIPEESLGDRRLHGVQAFDVCASAPAPRFRPGLGLALDIGTTTLAGALWDLGTGTCLATAAMPNEQRRFGDNVLTRIDHAAAAGHSRDLQHALVQRSIVPLLGELLAAAEKRLEDITEAEAAGNTIMLHTLAGESLAGFQTYPFRPVFLDARVLSAASLGLPADFPIRLPPCPGAFVGADITAGALASGILAEGAPALLIDFGTNGELLLRHGRRFLATATAVGPAFEGGRLRCGATAAPGVISSLRLEQQSWVATRVPGNGGRAARGLSGAAYIDYLALALASGRLGAYGRMVRPDLPSAPALDGHAGGRMEPLIDSLYVCEADIAELIQAKAAIGAGVLALLEAANLRISDLGTLYIAGGFGYHLTPAHAMAIGLIPTLPPERVQVIGNSSLAGASLRLLAGCDAGAEDFRKACEVLEINLQPNFEDLFIEGMSLRPLAD